MKKKTISLIISLALVLFGIGIIGSGRAEAQSASFPAGCSSAMGYSITTGTPCNGTNIATQSIPGCPTPIGYSTTSGVPCSGTSFPIFYLAGCTTGFGYSTVDGRPCNGTAAATFAPTTTPTIPATPGLPTTGEGGNAPINMLVLGISGIISIAGLTYLIRKHNIA